MVRELGRFCWTMSTVSVLSSRYFCANIVQSGSITVITVMTSAFNVEIQEVRINYEGQNRSKLTTFQKKPLELLTST